MISDLTKLEKIGSSFHIAFLLVFTVIGFIGNGLTIFVVVRVKKLSKPTNFFIANLAVADLIVCVIVNPFYVTTIIYQGWPLENDICKFIGFLTAWSCGASLMNLAAIAINRYMCIVWSHHYKRTFSEKNTILFCCSTWILALVSVLPPLFGFGSYDLNTNLMSCNISSSHDSWLYMASILSIYFGFTGLITCFCYYKIFKLVRTSSKKTKSQLPTERKKKQLFHRTDVKMAKNLLLVSLIFVVCWAPIMVLSIADMHGTTPVFLWRVVGILALANSMINPFIYARRNRAFQQAYLQTMKCNWANFSSINDSFRHTDSTAG
ncbi:melatonin receptor type 1C-like [Anneissia japonica]|uniref:melatonin receptor type 1C-like n=1 Tax=Anneissia japonica TaxID=1529436 RepID=UPI001425A37A|nr:melatonin receptor type 1C-like [Anneissia japonica]XP_033126849.1 melatonin receptor type 1C-like [Anneissia japonica]XP_033126850.1 melatonin receptor type 1C-like [Anneissia japonica]